MQLNNKNIISFSDLVNFYQQKLNENLSANLHQKRNMIFTNNIYNNLNQQQTEVSSTKLDASIEASKIWQEVKDKITQK